MAQKKKASETKKKQSNKSVKKEAEVKEESKKNDDDDEPSWYHYVIVLGIFFGFFALLYLGFNYFNDDHKKSNPNLLIDIYKYDFQTSDGRNVGIEFYNPIDTIDTFDYPIEVSRETFNSSDEIYISFMKYNGTDNGDVVMTSGRFVPFVSRLYWIPMDFEKHFVRFNETNCSDSTLDAKVVVFDPYSDRNGVFYDETNGCITFETDDPDLMRDLGDKFFLTLIEQEKE